MAYLLNIMGKQRFFVRGKLPGWDKQVPDLHLRAEISQVFKHGSRELLAREIPKRLVFQEPRKLPPAFFSIGGLVIVQEPIRELLERLDPGVHQLVPIDAVWWDGTAPVHPCHVLNVHAMQDSIIDEESDVEISHGYKTSDNMTIKQGFKRVTVRASAFSGVHLWRERRYPGAMLMSDGLYDALEANGLEFFEAIRIAEA